MYAASCLLTIQALDAQDNEDLVGALVQVDNQNFFTNELGQIATEVLCGDSVLIVVEYISFEPRIQKIKVESDTVLIFYLELLNNLPQVEVQAKYSNHLNKGGLLHIPVDRLQQVPAIGGEVDLIKAFTMLPGVEQGVAGTSQFSVRGSGLGDNLVLLDDVPLYNAYHYYNFLSIFNEELVKDVKFYKGYAPASYFGKTGGVLDFSMREGNQKEKSYSLGIGLTTTSFSYSGPIKMNKNQTLVAGGRLFQLGLVGLPSEIRYGLVDSADANGLYIYDVFLKGTFKFENEAKLTTSLYSGRDVVTYREKTSNTLYKSNQVWGNTFLQARYFNAISNNIFYTVSGSLAHYVGRYDELNRNKDYNLNYTLENKINSARMHAKIDFLGTINKTIGVNAEFNSFGSIEAFNLENIQQNYLGGYAQIYWQHKGIEFRSDARLGSYNWNNQIIWLFEPKLQFNVALTSQFGLEVGYVRQYQPNFLIQAMMNHNPIDVWVPAQNVNEIQMGTQVSAGINFQTNSNKHQFNVSYYQKKATNQIYTQLGTSLSVLSGSLDIWKGGVANIHGLESIWTFDLEKWKGWLGLSYLRSLRQFNEINRGNSFDFRHAPRFSIKSSLVFTQNSKNSWGINLIWQTGRFFTAPTTIQTYFGQENRIHPVYESLNNYQTTGQYRIDISLSRKGISKGGKDRTITYSLFNATGARNVFSTGYESGFMLETSLLNFIPGFSIKYEWVN